MIRAYRFIYFALLAAALSGLASAVQLLPEAVRLALVVGALALLLAAVVVMVQAVWRDVPKLNLGAFAAGALIVFGGTAFDVAMTVTVSPDLVLEANPIARLLLDAEFSLKWVYVIGGVGQILLALMVVAAFSGFLLEKSRLLSRINSSGLASTLSQLFGGPGASVKSVLAGKVDYKYCVLFSSPVFVTLYGFRWYLGMEWLGIFPMDGVLRMLVASALLLLGTLIVGKYAQRELKKLGR